MVHAPPEEDLENKQLSVGSGVHAICIRGRDDLYDLAAVRSGDGGGVAYVAPGAGVVAAVGRTGYPTLTAALFG